MIRTTPFYERTRELNATGLWVHWAGYLVADKYQMSSKREYYAVRTAAGLFDTSPLYKYRIIGRDAESFLAGALVRDVRTCAPGRAQYTMWCDERGFVIEDGVVLRLAPDEFLLTSAEPNLAHFARLAGDRAVTIEDVSVDYGILALQGPRSGEILAVLTDQVAALEPFGVCRGEIGGARVMISRTGYTGGPGYEVWVEPGDALAVWDAVASAGDGRGLMPYGSRVLHMARIEAGLLLIDVDYTSSRFAWTDEQRATPAELGYGWMVQGGVAPETPRWRLRGVMVDWHDYQRVHDAAGQPAPEHHDPVESAMAIYDRDGADVGFATSFMFSPLLKRHIAMGRVPPALAAPGTEVGLEIEIDHRPVTVRARICRLPFWPDAS